MNPIVEEILKNPARLTETDQLRGALEYGGKLYNVSVEQKHDGKRSFLHITPEGATLYTRSGKPFPDYIQNGNLCLNNLKSDKEILLDCELVAQVEGEESTVDLVNRKDTRKMLVYLDCLYCNKDVREYSLDRRRDTLRKVIALLKLETRGNIVIADYFQTFTVQELNQLIANSKALNIEGYVVKELNNTYNDDLWGYKIKREETLDGFIVAFREEKKSGKKTGRVGTVGICTNVGLLEVLRPDSPLAYIAAWVPLNEEHRVEISQFKEKLRNRVLEFKHFGHGITPLRSCQFIRWRDNDKTKEQCWRILP